MKWLKNITHAVGSLSPSCREAVRLQSEAMDHPLPPARRLGLRIHLMLCKWCRRYGSQLEFLRTANRQDVKSPSPTSSAGMSPEARKRIQQRLEEARK